MHASPQTSGRLDFLVVITGHPQAMASSGGQPKPSCEEGKTKTSERLYKSTSSWSDALSTRKTRCAIPRLKINCLLTGPISPTLSSTRLGSCKTANARNKDPKFLYQLSFPR